MKNAAAPSITTASPSLRKFDVFKCVPAEWKLVRFRFGRPPALVFITRNARCIEQARAAIGKCVIGLAMLAHRALVALSHAIVTGAVGIADFLPNPPAIVRPDSEDITVAVPKKDHLHRRFDSRPAADVVLVPGWSAKGRRRSPG